MLADLHLAEHTFALHLPLQRLEGLVDIVVTDENLHAMFLLNQMVDRPNGHGANATGVLPTLYSIRSLTGNEKLCQLEESR